MKKLTYEEYKIIHKKLTRTQRAYYEECCEYRTRLNNEKINEEMLQFKMEMTKIKERIL